MVVMMLVIVIMFARALVVIVLFRKDHVLELNRLLHGVEQLAAGQIIPRRGDDNRILVVLSDQGNAGLQLLLADALRTAQNDRVRTLDLIVVELAEVLHVHLAFIGIGHRYERIDLDRCVLGYVLYGTADIRELADTGRLDDNAVRMELTDDIAQCGAEITDQ